MGDKPYQTVIADVDDGTVSMLLGTNGGTFGPATRYTVDAGARSPCPATSAVTATCIWRRPRSLAAGSSLPFEDGTGTFTVETEVVTVTRPHGLLLTNFDSDGDPHIPTASVATGRGQRGPSATATAPSGMSRSTRASTSSLRLTVPAAQICPLPPELPLHRAVLAEPPSVALHAVHRAADVRGRRVLATGASPIGCLVTAVLSDRGAAEVVVSDLLDTPLRIAAASGATATVRADEPGNPSWSPEFDVAVAASGPPPVCAPAWNASGAAARSSSSACGRRARFPSWATSP